MWITSQPSPCACSVNANVEVGCGLIVLGGDSNKIAIVVDLFLLFGCLCSLTRHVESTYFEHWVGYCDVGCDVLRLETLPNLPLVRSY